MTANVSSTPPASPSPSPLHAVVADDFEAVNRTIVTQLNSRVPLVETIGQYIIESGGKRLRPHFKAHKCTEIAKRQLAAGARRRLAAALLAAGAGSWRAAARSLRRLPA